MPGSIPTSGTSLRQSLVRQRREKSSHQYTDLDNGIVVGGAESDPLAGLAGEWADTEDLVADAAPSLALSPNEEMCLFLLKRAFQDLRSYNGWLTECLGPAIKGWEMASHGERHRRVVRLKSALVRCLNGIAGVRAYLIEREGLFEMTCGLCDFDPQVFREEAERIGRDEGLNENLEAARRLVRRWKRIPRLLNKSSRLSCAELGSTGTSS